MGDETRSDRVEGSDGRPFWPFSWPIDAPTMPATAGLPVHPAYAYPWERDFTPTAAEVARHDLTETRWLTAQHRVLLEHGLLALPRRCNYAHEAVLVSVPNEFEGTEVSWVDRGLAPVVYLAERLFIRTVECCEGGPRGDAEHGTTDAMLWFESRWARDRFVALFDPSPPHWYAPGYRPRWWSLLDWRDRLVNGGQVRFPTTDIPRVVAHLIELEQT